MINERDRVMAIKPIGDISMGDLGTVIAAPSARAIILVRWDKDGIARPINRKKVQLR